jgi:nucleoside-diphosphate-sugar epimerase
MRILITGAAGFIGRSLAARIRQLGGIGESSPALERLVLCDATFAGATGDAELVEGDLSDPAVCAAALASEPDLVFHLAAVPGGAAEADYELGRRVNLDAAMALTEGLRNRPRKPRLVMSSSIAVFGSPLPSVVDDDTPPSPALSYGTQKLMLEIYLADLARRGEIDARLLRLPGIVARPRQAGGHISAYMSNVFHAIAAGESFTCPVAAGATAWFMSVDCVVDNLLHAARLPGERLSHRVLTLPALRLTMAELVDAIGAATGQPAARLVTYEPVPAIEAQFGRYPPLRTPRAEASGFRHDGDAAALVRRALASAGIAPR